MLITPMNAFGSHDTVDKFSEPMQVGMHNVWEKQGDDLVMGDVALRDEVMFVLQQMLEGMNGVIDLIKVTLMKPTMTALVYRRPHVKLFVEFVIMRVMGAIWKGPKEMDEALKDIMVSKGILDSKGFGRSQSTKISKQTPYVGPQPNRTILNKKTTAKVHEVISLFPKE